MRYFIYLSVLGLLIGCQTQQHDLRHGGNTKTNLKKGAMIWNSSTSENTEKDGAPAGPLPVFFKEVKPKVEPLSRYGNPDVYMVNGRTYEVMTNTRGYRTRGLASWYGTKFHHRRTSSGENYDMYALTAAHKTLPLPSYVRVKNLNNGRVAIVKVNDRGPFHSNRIIDLSYAAAAKLGMMPKGTASVEIEALALKGTSKQRTAHYYLQAGAFNSEKLAAGLKSKLAKLTSSPVFIEKYERRFIVKVGPFATKQMTDKLKLSLKKCGVSGTYSMIM